MAVKIFKELPLTIREFIKSMNHMSFPTVSERQLRMMEFMTGTDITKIFLNNRYMAIAVMGKGCLSGDEEVILSNGEIRTVKELSNVIGCHVFSLDNNYKLCISHSTKFYKKGKAMLYEVITSYGKRVKVTLEHKFLTMNGWKELKELTINDYIAGPSYLSLPETVSIDLFECRLVGYLLHDQVSFKQYSAISDFIDSLNKYASNFNGIFKKVYNKFVKTENKIRFNKLTELVRNKYKLSKKRIPLIFFKATKKCKINLIESLFIVAGKVNFKKKVIEYSNNNFELVRDLQNLLLSFNIISKIEFINNNLYKLIICDDKSLYLFCKYFSIPVYDREQKLFVKYLKRSIENNCDEESNQFDNVLELVWEKIVSIKEVGVDDYYSPTVSKTHNYIASGLFHHNSGKDTCIVNMFCYFIYYLLCLNNPQEFLGLLEHDPIDMVNVAMSKEQASQVFFEMLKRKLQSWIWLKNNYKIAYASSGSETNKDTVIILKNAVYFPKNIRLFSGHSDAGSLEGKNILCWVMDESSGFANSRTDKAEELYRMLRTSAVSRFGNKYKGFIISYPRQKDDFTIKMFTKHLDNLSVYTDKGPTWEIKPPQCFSGKVFRFKDYFIPIEFKEDFEKDPFGSMTCYMCIPSEVESPFIELPEKVDKVSVETPIALFEDYVEGVKVKKRLVNWIKPSDKLHVLGVDLGLRTDSACVASMYVEERNGMVHFGQDLILSWTPKYEKDEVVSFDNVGEILIELCKKLKVMAVVFDKWNSAMLIEILNKNGISSFDITTTSQDYLFLKELIYTGRISLIADSLQVQELKKLIMLRGNKVDHLPQYSKDRVDAIVCALRVLKEEKMLTKKSPSGWGNIGDDFLDAPSGGFFVV